MSIILYYATPTFFGFIVINFSSTVQSRLSKNWKFLKHFCFALKLKDKH